MKSDLPIMEEFREDMKKHYPQDPLNILSFASYFHTTILIEGLKRIEGKITQEKLLNKIEQMKNEKIGGLLVDFNLQTRHAYPHVISLIEG